MDTHNPAPPYPPHAVAAATHPRQRGLTLGIALIFLLLATLLGVSALQVSALEQVLAGNTQQSYRRFQAVESGIDAAFRSALRSRTQLRDSSVIERAYTFDGIAVATRTAYRGAARTLPYGYSLRGEFRAQHFAIRGVAQTRAGSEAAHERGLAVIGPGRR